MLVNCKFCKTVSRHFWYERQTLGTCPLHGHLGGLNVPKSQRNLNGVGAALRTGEGVAVYDDTKRMIHLSES